MSQNNPPLTSAQLRAQALALQEQARALELEEKKKLIEQVRALIAQGNLSAQDVFPSKRGRPAAAGKAPASAPYYINPQTGETAQKLGKPKEWVIALRASNTPLEQYVIEKMTPEALAAARAKTSA